MVVAYETCQHGAAEYIHADIHEVKLREAPVEGMRAAREAAQRTADALIEAETCIAEVPPGPTLIDTHGLPDDEGDDWDIRVGKVAAERDQEEEKK